MSIRCFPHFHLFQNDILHELLYYGGGALYDLARGDELGYLLAQNVDMRHCLLLSISSNCRGGYYPPEIRSMHMAWADNIDPTGSALDTAYHILQQAAAFRVAELVDVGALEHIQRRLASETA